ncbi:MAG: helix-turn-helix transcriptional regulator [Candidatus Nanopelagicaceae bacterium]
MKIKESAPDQKTREAVARSILENGPSTAAELSNRLGITPAGIRRHLDTLVEEGTLDARDPHAALTKGRGRPSKVFVMTDSGRERFEHSYDDLAISALRFMAAKDPNFVKQFAQNRADELERQINKTFESSKDKVKALADFLTTEGYSSTVHKVGTGHELCQHHCPIAHVAAEFPDLCEAETAVFSKTLGTHVQRLATIAHGDGVCTTYIPIVTSKVNSIVTSKVNSQKSKVSGKAKLR